MASRRVHLIWNRRKYGRMEASLVAWFSRRAQIEKAFLFFAGLCWKSSPTLDCAYFFHSVSSFMRLKLCYLCQSMCSSKTRSRCHSPTSGSPGRRGPVFPCCPRVLPQYESRGVFAIRVLLQGRNRACCWARPRSRAGPSPSLAIAPSTHPRHDLPLPLGHTIRLPGITRSTIPIQCRTICATAALQGN